MKVKARSPVALDMWVQSSWMAHKIVLNWYERHNLIFPIELFGRKKRIA